LPVRCLLPLFTQADDAEALLAVTLGERLLWLAAIYQVFDGLNMGSSLCLRGAGDVVIPAALVIPVSWIVFVPAGARSDVHAGAGVGAFPAAGSAMGPSVGGRPWSSM